MQTQTTERGSWTKIIRLWTHARHKTAL